MSWVGMSLVGLFVGILIGALVAPWLAHKFIPPGATHTQARALTATAIFLFFIFTLQGLGAMVGLRMTEPHRSRVLPVHIGNLRRKVEEDPAKPRYILTVPGIGYRFAQVPPQD